jgi:flavin reductase (DIM6/NTAB) family NADH-FMN oxidoreductase RutF
MEKIKIDSNAFVYPMPMVIVGVTVGGKPNFMAVGWVSRVNYKPPLIAIALGKAHHTTIGIQENKTFSVNVPGVDLIKETDHCGLVSGKKVDKSKLFEVFYGQLKTAPMVKRCPVCMECRVINTLDMEADTLFIAEIAGAYSEEKFMTGGKPDIRKMKPFTLTMPDCKYWAVGEELGKAWDIGREGDTQ